MPVPVSRDYRMGNRYANAAESRHMNRVAEIGQCVMAFAFGFGESCVANNGPIELHHIREGQGAAQRAAHTLVVPLCWGHHQGSQGIHGLGRKGFYTRYQLDELDLLAATLERIA